MALDGGGRSRPPRSDLTSTPFHEGALMKANRLHILASRTLLCAALVTTVACKKEAAKEAVKPGTPAPAAPVVSGSAGPLNLLPQEAALVGGVSIDALRRGKLWSTINESRET